ncbi:unnamed protein product [Rangifer tarandus platyrhynchus]|uniref:Uncharacterized protein n=1 Tax=Rangifer tarandus platyrhynchus TaxID=3082113 RepID=A0AC59YK82_RANTA
MKQIKMNYSPGPPSHPLTSKQGMRSGSRGSGGQIKALWTRFTAVLVVHLGAVERKTVPTGGLWLLEPRSRRSQPHAASAGEKSLVPELPESVSSPLPLPRGSPPSPPPPSLLPPPRFHSIDFCCRSTFITDSPTGAKNSRLQIQGCGSRREAPLPSPEPACLVQPRRPVKRPAPGVPAWTAAPGVLDPWILQAQPCGGPAEPPLHLNVRPAGRHPGPPWPPELWLRHHFLLTTTAALS